MYGQAWCLIEFNLSEPHEHHLGPREAGSSEEGEASAADGEADIDTVVNMQHSDRLTLLLVQVVTMVLVFCLSWGPYALLSLIGILGYSEVCTQLFISFSHSNHETMNFSLVWFRWCPCMWRCSRQCWPNFQFCGTQSSTFVWTKVWVN